MGLGFGLDGDFVYHEISLDSLDATKTPPAEQFFTPYNWPVFELGKQLQNVAALKILSAEIPFVYYVVSHLRNASFRIEDVTGGSGLLTGSIPFGNYTVDTMATALATAMTALVPGKSYVVTYSALTGQYTITQTAAGVWTLDWFQPVEAEGGYHLGNLIGIPTPTARRLQTTTAGGVMVLPNIVNVTGPNYLYLHSNTFGNAVNVGLPRDALFGNIQSGVSTQIAVIPVNVNPGEVIEFVDRDDSHWQSLENLFSVNTIDMFWTLGNSPSSQFLVFPGVGWHVKLGLLQHDTGGNLFQSGTKDQGRVKKRIRPNNN